MLLPVQLAGVASSLAQAATGRKARFARTPKVPGRTPAPARYHAAEFGLLMLMLGSLAADVAHARWFHGGFVTANVLALVYAMIWMIGLRSIRDDLALARRAESPALATGSAQVLHVPGRTR
jgi:hypothetical protein